VSLLSGRCLQLARYSIPPDPGSSFVPHGLSECRVWHLPPLCEPRLSREFVLYLDVHSVYLPASLFFSSINAIMALRVTQPSKQPMPATIDIPDPAPWTVLDGDAVTQDYGWRQPQYNALISGRGFDADFDTILENPNLPLGILFSDVVFLAPELERLADSRQTKFEGTPNKDGSNLHEFNFHLTNEDAEGANGSVGLQSMYDYMKDILQMLYRNNLVTVDESTHPSNGQFVLNLNRLELDRFMDMITRGSRAAQEREIERLRDPVFGPAFALGFEWVPAFRKSVVDGVLGIQAALWWSIEQSYNPIPHMQQVSLPDLFGVRTLSVGLICHSGDKHGSLNHHAHHVPTYAGAQIRAIAGVRTCRRHPHGQAPELAFPKGHVHDRTCQRPGSVPYLGYDDETSFGNMAEPYASMLRLSNAKRLGIWETLEEDVRCA
jgi:hypothetical protein